MNQIQFPKGYRPIEVMDFVRNRRQMKIVCLSGLVSIAVLLVLGLLMQPLAPTWTLIRTHQWTLAAAAAIYIAYIPLHELTHGLLMHALSGVRPNYGLKLPYAYAGSRVYFDRKSHNLIALAPLIFFGAVLFALERALPKGWFWLIYPTQISNISGSMGDVYCVLHLRKLPRDVMIQDTGTRMRIFAPKPRSEEQP